MVVVFHSPLLWKMSQRLCPHVFNPLDTSVNDYSYPQWVQGTSTTSSKDLYSTPSKEQEHDPCTRMTHVVSEKKTSSDVKHQVWDNSLHLGTTGCSSGVAHSGCSVHQTPIAVACILYGSYLAVSLAAFKSGSRSPRANIRYQRLTSCSLAWHRHSGSRGPYLGRARRPNLAAPAETLPLPCSTVPTVPGRPQLTTG
ncbi:hypothetical protein BCV69DRAFT_27023 [Microstroma glucosiphilum]|uniref:Uncharacterized protein n=1 Tax=Pseudomicrostroma glucosiphilum TaxID=1684307 RepID=A0A316U5M1_9BASI|nr:hypothetical protein BCV69DRAFT_27023 [Pseudomicrostroma glucosiphilum]PWN19633.1 hypothetical protein BCV69DRAFT_27023 [Pseudomicrostroma glucosiphilum]